MTQSFAIMIAIVIVAIALVTRFSSLSSVRKVSRRWLLGGLIFVVLVGLGIWWFNREPREEPRPAPTTQTTLTKVLIPWFDGFTPCDPTFDFTFELDTQGDPIFMKFPGVKKPVPYSGKGQLDLEDPANPIKRLSGPVHITSQDSQKQARVRIWKVVYIRA